MIYFLILQKSKTDLMKCIMVLYARLLVFLNAITKNLKSHVKLKSKTLTANIFILCFFCFYVVKTTTNMVSPWETIKGFALACKREALDCHPSGDHARAKPLILCEAQACMREAHDCNPSGYHGFPLGNNQGLRPCMLVRSTRLSPKGWSWKNPFVYKM